jgi:hypothetical protein
MSTEQELFQKFNEYFVKPELILDGIWYQDTFIGILRIIWRI